MAETAIDRRTFAKTTVAGALATMLPALPTPRFTEVDWIHYRSPEPFDCDLTLCDLCLANGLADIDGHGKPIRKFFHDSREQLIVCEHCLPGYLEEEQTSHART